MKLTLQFYLEYYLKYGIKLYGSFNMTSKKYYWRIKILANIFMFFPVLSSGQVVVEDFESNDLSRWYTNNEAWCISGNNAFEGNYSMQHCYDNAEAAFDMISYFHDPLLLNNQATEWEFSIRYGFNPSGNNYWLVFITNNEIPNDAGKIDNGLVIGVNYQGSDDVIQMASIVNGEVDQLLQSAFNWEEHVGRNQWATFTLQYNANTQLGLRISLPDSDMQLLGGITLTEPDSYNTFTLFSRYTSTYDQGLWFDKLIIDGKSDPDITAPELLAISVLNPTTIQIDFNEPINISANPFFSIESIGELSCLNTFGSELIMELPHAMTPSAKYTLQLPVIADVYNNTMPVSELSQGFYYPGAYDLLITEIMADPTPQIGLPNAEYLEITNRTLEGVHIKGWHVSINGRSVSLPDMSIEPGEYIVLSNTEAVDSFQAEQVVIGIDGFPALSNAGAEVLLHDASGMLIHPVTYEDDWHADPTKRDGGWALEMINLLAPCLGSDNWISSVNETGGTPGQANSVNQELLLTTTPEPWRAAITDSGTLMLYFSEPLDSLTASNSQYYFVNKGIGSPHKVLCSWPLPNSVELFFDIPFEENTNYFVSLTTDIENCEGVSLGVTDAIRFRKCKSPETGDVVVNEILFDPADDCVEFMELYNASGESIELKDFKFSVESGDTGKIITHEYWPLHDGEYAVIASSYWGISTADKFEKANCIILMPSMPTLTNSGSDVFLYTNRGYLIDELSYLPEYHHAQYTQTKGISLERVDALGPGNDPDNWQSASADAGYMTPALPNSQVITGQNALSVSVHPQSITPNDDGIDDKLYIEYELDKPGFMGDVFIYNSLGVQLAVLAQGAVLGTSGEFIFNGRSENGNVPLTGYYIVFFKAYHENGTMFSRKKTFVIAHQ